MAVLVLRALVSGVLLTGLFLSFSTMQSAAQEVQQSAINTPAPPRAGPTGSKSHYVEFRVAEIGTYGHSYAAFGRLKPNGQPASASYADLHPVGNYALMAIGHVVPVPANTA